MGKTGLSTISMFRAVDIVGTLESDLGWRVGILGLEMKRWEDSREYDEGVEVPEGPWNDEPSEMTVRLADGWVLRVLRVQAGHLCGYVSMPEKAEGDTYDIYSFDVHGGVTWDKQHESVFDGMYTIGFDAGHTNDVKFKTPYTEKLVDNRMKYRSFLYVLEETVKLYKQLKNSEVVQQRVFKKRVD